MIKPPNTASIWVIDDKLYFEFPSARTEKTHQVSLPATEQGFSTGLAILRARHSDSTVGTKGAPVQHDLEKLADEFLKNGGKVKKREKFITPELKASATDILREMGLV